VNRAGPDNLSGSGRELVIDIFAGLTTMISQVLSGQDAWHLLQGEYIGNPFCGFTIPKRQ